MSNDAVFMMEYDGGRLEAAQSAVEALWWRRRRFRFGSAARGRCDERFFSSGDAIECHIGYVFDGSDEPDFLKTAGELFEIAGHNLMYFRGRHVAAIDIDEGAAAEAQIETLMISELSNYMPDMSDFTYYRLLGQRATRE